MTETSWDSVPSDQIGPESLNPLDVEAKIISLISRLSEALTEWKKLYKTYKDTERAFDQAVAHARIKAADAGITANDRRYYAEIDPFVIDARAAMDMAEVVYKYSDERLRAIRSALSAWQSVGRSVQTAYMNAGR